jgi:hypothetical protein
VEQGKLDEAQADLDYGSGETWAVWVMKPYVEGRLAVARGDRATALEKFQYAEATLPWGFGPVLLKRIRQEISALGGAPLTVTAQAYASTPIATPLVTATPRATSTFYYRNPPTPTVKAPKATPVALVQGLGPLTLPANAYPVYHFSPAEPISFKQIKTLTFRLLPAAEGSPKPTLQLYPWSQSDGGWGLVRLDWGDNPVDHPESFVSSKGDIYVGLRNWGSSAVQIKAAGFRLIVEQDDGSEATYGLQP